MTDSMPIRVFAAGALSAAFILVAGVARADAGTGPWERVSNEKGIVVERRTVEGSSLKEFLGKGVVEAPIWRVLAVIRDSPHRTEWVSNCTASYTVEEDDAARYQISYQRTHAPWPVSDRDSINRAELRVEPEKHRVYITFEGISHPKVPPVKGAVRMPFLRGHWIMTPVDHGKSTQVEYQVHANPGGSLPDWLSNLASKTLPRETIEGLRAQVKRRQYPEFEAQIQNAPEAKGMFEGL